MPLDFLKRHLQKGSSGSNNSSSNNNESSTTSTDNSPSSPQRISSIRIKHKSTIAVQLKIEIETISQHITINEQTVTCFPSDLLENFVKEKLLNFLPNNNSSSTTTTDSFRSFREKYALFVVREFSAATGGGGEKSAGGGDWIFNYGLTFADLNVKGVCTIECVLQKKKIQVQFGVDQQFAKPTEINELKSVEEISFEIAKSFMIKKEFVSDFSLKDTAQQWLIPQLTLREQVQQVNEKTKLQLAKKYNFTFDQLLESDIKLNTVSLSLTYSETKERFMNGKLNYNILDRKERNIIARLVALSILAEGLDRKYYKRVDDVSKFESLVPPHFYAQIQETQKMKTKMRKKFIKNLQRNKTLIIVDAQCEYVKMCSQHPFFKLNLYKVEFKQETSPSQDNNGDNGGDNGISGGNQSDFTEILFGIDDQGLCTIHSTDRCIISSTPFTSIVSYSAIKDMLRIVVKQPEPILESTMLIKSNLAEEIEIIIAGAIEYSNRNIYMSPQVKDVQEDVQGSDRVKKSCFALPTDAPTDDIQLLLSDRNIVEKALQGLTEYNRQVKTKSGPIQALLVEKQEETSSQRKKVIGKYMEELRKKDANDTLNNDTINVFTKPFEYLEMYDPVKKTSELMEESYFKLIEVELERKARESEVTLLEHISKGLISGMSVNSIVDLNLESSNLDQQQQQVYPKQVLDMKREYDMAFKQINVESTTNVNMESLNKIKQMFDQQAQYLLQYEKYLHDKFVRLEKLSSNNSSIPIETSTTTASPSLKKSPPPVPTNNTPTISTTTNTSKSSTTTTTANSGSGNSPTTTTATTRKISATPSPQESLSTRTASPTSSRKTLFTPPTKSSTNIDTTTTNSNNIGPVGQGVGQQQSDSTSTDSSSGNSTTSSFSDLRSKFLKNNTTNTPPATTEERKPIGFKGRTTTVLETLKNFEKK